MKLIITTSSTRAAWRAANYSISHYAEVRRYVSLPQVLPTRRPRRMRAVLADIQDGTLPCWMHGEQARPRSLQFKRDQLAKHPMEQVGEGCAAT